MRTLFDLTSRNGKERAFTAFAPIQKGLEINLNRVTIYNAENQQKTYGTDPFLRLLNVLNFPVEYHGDHYWDLVWDSSNELATAADFTNAINAGRLWQGIKKESPFGENIDAVFISYVGPKPELNALGRLEVWEGISPLSILHTPSTDLNLTTPTGKNHSAINGVAVIAVDIGLLAMVYREWRLRELTKPPELRQSKQQFSHFYLMNKLIPSQLNCALFNRLVKSLAKESSDDGLSKPTTPLVDYSSKVDKVYDNIIKQLIRTDQTVEEMLDTIPLRQFTQLRDIIPDIPVPTTRKVYWALLLAYLPYVEFLSTVLFVNGSQINRDFQRKLKRMLKDIKNDRLLDGCPDMIVHDYLASKIDTLTELLP